MCQRKSHVTSLALQAAQIVAITQTAGHPLLPLRSLQPCNQLLACLSQDDWRRLMPLMTLVKLAAGQVLIQADKPFPFVYFPLSGVVALHSQVENGDASVLSLVGSEGVVGVSSFMGGESTTSHATVFSAGSFLRIHAKDLLREFEHTAPLSHLLLRYTQALMSQITQTAACNRLHTVDSAFSRFLLLYLDRSKSSELLLTHEKVANLLGVRREGVSEAAMRLQRQGLIRYSRGRVQVLDRVGLEAGTCECYHVIKTEYDRLLPRKIAI